MKNIITLLLLFSSFFGMAQSTLADLVVTKTSTSTHYSLNSIVEYTITIENLGPDNAAGVVITDLMPDGIYEMYWQSSTGSSGSGDFYEWIGVIPVGEVITIQTQVVIPGNFNLNQPLINRVSVTTTTIDPTPINPDNPFNSYIEHILTSAALQNYVTVSTTEYTLEQLVKDVLVNANCSAVTNIRAQGMEQNTIGYFNSNGSNFPLEAGIIIKTGDANDVEGPHVTGSINVQGTGMIDGASTPPPYNINHLQQISNSVGQTETVSDVSYIEFDFYPLSDYISFNFLFASNEYGTFQCDYADVFGFILTDLTTGEWKNLAVLPNNPSQIVSVTTIRNSAYNSNCPSANPQYFGSFNMGVAPINMFGNTVRMTASSEVVPCRPYRIKLAIGDYSDTGFDSAVFIEAGSFNIDTISLGRDKLISEGSALCSGGEVLLKSGVEELIQDCQLTYQTTWYRNGEVIPGATDSNYLATQEGTYSVTASIIINGSNPIQCTLNSDPITIEFYPEFDFQAHQTYTSCSDINSETATFDLSAIAEQLAQGTSAAVSFYLTEQDAQNNTGEITNTTNFTNTSNPQTIYIRAQHNSSCYDIAPIVLNVLENPQIVPPSDYILCDEDANGNEVFNLDSKAEEILNHLSGIQLSFYTSENDARNGSQAINNPTAYVSNGEKIWVRGVNSDGCVSIVSFDLVVYPNVELTSISNYETCSDISNQGLFDLTSKNDEIANGNPYTISYFESLSNAQNNIFPIPNPENYSNLSNPQTIYVRVENEFGCVAYNEFDLIVNPNPIVFPPQDIELCDEDHNGIETFDLSALVNDITGGNPDIVISFHTTYEQALNNINAIGNPNAYMAPSSSIYIRAANHYDNGFSCAKILELNLVVNQMPEVVDSSFHLCKRNTTGFSAFYLPDFVSDLLGSQQNPADFTISYHLTQSGAENHTNIIPQDIPFENTVQYSQVIWVKIQNNFSGCTTIAPITLYVVEDTVAYSPLDNEIFMCDYDGQNDGITSGIDLTVFHNEILGNQNPNLFQLTYHFTEQEAINGQNAINNPNHFTNTIADVQTIWVRVENANPHTPCFDVTPIQIRVERLPEAEVPDYPFVLCVDYGKTMANNTVVLDSGISGTGYQFEWYQNGVLISGENSSTLTLNHIDDEGLYYVIITNPNGCRSLPSEVYEVIVSGTPEVVSVNTSGAFAPNQEIDVRVQGNGEYFYQLNNGPLQLSGHFQNVPPGLHTVTIYPVINGEINQSYSCPSSVIYNIRLIDYPRFFTPNGDGYNDYWNIVGLTEEYNAEILIFDRYGKIITSIKPNQPGWDGTYNGNPLPATDYWFKIEYNEPYSAISNSTQRKVFKSHFSLKR